MARTAPLYDCRHAFGGITVALEQEAKNRPFDALAGDAHVEETLSECLHLGVSLGVLQAEMGGDERASQNGATATVRHGHNVGFDVDVNLALEESANYTSGYLCCVTHALIPALRVRNAVALCELGRAHHRYVFLIFCLAAILLAHKLSRPRRVNSTACT